MPKYQLRVGNCVRFETYFFDVLSYKNVAMNYRFCCFQDSKPQTWEKTNLPPKLHFRIKLSDIKVVTDMHPIRIHTNFHDHILSTSGFINLQNCLWTFPCLTKITNVLFSHKFFEELIYETLPMGL